MEKAEPAPEHVETLGARLVSAGLGCLRYVRVVLDARGAHSMLAHDPRNWSVNYLGAEVSGPDSR